MTIIGVMSAADQAAARAVVEREQAPWPNTFEATRMGRHGAIPGKIAGDYKIRNVPQAVLIGADGRIIHPAISSVGLRAVLDGYAR